MDLNYIKVNALEDIIKETIGLSGAFVHELCVANKDIVTIGGEENLDTHICGSYEDEIIWVEKVGLLKLWDILKLI